MTTLQQALADTFANGEVQTVKTYDNVVKVTTYLSSHEHRMEYRALRDEILGGRRPALTVVICDIFDPAWLLEVDVIAAA